jgi:hypothetical protein
MGRKTPYDPPSDRLSRDHGHGRAMGGARPGEASLADHDVHAGDPARRGDHAAPRRRAPGA